MAHTARGKICSDMGQYERSIEDYDRAIELDPQPSAYLRRGEAYHLMGRFERAIEDFDEAIRLDPQYAQAYYVRGMVYERLGKTKEAELDYQKAKELGYEQSPTPAMTPTPTVMPTPIGEADYFTVGSHMDDVLKLQGTPSSVSDLSLIDKVIWSFGISSVTFKKSTSRVIEWSDYDGSLKTQMVR